MPCNHSTPWCKHKSLPPLTASIPTPIIMLRVLARYRNIWGGNNGPKRQRRGSSTSRPGTAQHRHRPRHHGSQRPGADATGSQPHPHNQRTTRNLSLRVVQLRAHRTATTRPKAQVLPSMQAGGTERDCSRPHATDARAPGRSEPHHTTAATASRQTTQIGKQAQKSRLGGEAAGQGRVPRTQFSASQQFAGTTHSQLDITARNPAQTFHPSQQTTRRPFRGTVPGAQQLADPHQLPAVDQSAPARNPPAE